MTLKIQYEYPIYVDQIYPKGFLKIDRRYHACWTYYVLAQKIKEIAGDSIDDQIIEEGMAWMDKPYANIAKSVATRYGLDSPDDFLRKYLIKAIRLEAARLGLPRPHDEYMQIEPGKMVTV